jgi:hypothetical protein
MYIQSYYYGKIPIEMWEFMAYGVAIFLVWVFSGIITRKRLTVHPEYRFFRYGLWAKILGGLGFGLIYIFYYGGGDTVAYYQTAYAFCELFYHDTGTFVETFFGEASKEAVSVFSEKTGHPLHSIYFNDQTRFVMKCLVPIMLLTGKSYFLTTLLISIGSYWGIWRLYLTFVSHFPQYARNLAIGILFMPSVVFWGSGILKDSFTLTATCFFLAEINNVILRKKAWWKSALVIIIASWMIISIKPYIFLILLPGALVWMFYTYIKTIRNRLFRYSVLPLIYVIIIGGSYFLLTSLGDQFGKFSVDQALQTAVVTQQDLKQEYYQGSSFDIGSFEPTIIGVLSKFPQATVAGLFRPFVWESNNVVMLLSGVENFFILFVTVWVLVQLRWSWIKKMIGDYPILLCSVVFSVLFGFMIGLTTSNFGALVRFKIPLVPMYMATMLILFSKVESFKIVKGQKKWFVG